MDNYPIGADTPDSPWNQTENPEREVNVTISITLSKTIKVKVKDYKIIESGKDEEGEYFEDIDYSECNLSELKKVYSPSFILDGWDIDEFETIIE